MTTPLCTTTQMLISSVTSSYPAEIPVPTETVLLMECMQTGPLKVSMIRRSTDRDPTLAKVRHYTQQGWPTSVKSAELSPYLQRSSELCVQDGCVLWGNRVIIPPQGCSTVVYLLHESHSGISRKKKEPCQKLCVVAWHGCSPGEEGEGVWPVSGVSKGSS